MDLWIIVLWRLLNNGLVIPNNNNFFLVPYLLFLLFFGRRFHSHLFC